MRLNGVKVDSGASVGTGEQSKIACSRSEGAERLPIAKGSLGCGESVVVVVVVMLVGVGERCMVTQRAAVASLCVGGCSRLTDVRVTLLCGSGVACASRTEIPL